MYEVFDSFISTDTWSTGHDLDMERFYQALALVVRDDGFSPDKMGEYFKGKVNAVHHNYADELVTKAWAVRDFLHATHA